MSDTHGRDSVSCSDATIVVGLEVHVQLKTDSKLFCGCSIEFGAAPNTQTCPVCTGMPGSLPVLNQRAIRLAIKTGLALNCDIARYTKWDRKNYFYPDLPKGYQTSQFDLPICRGGHLVVTDPKSTFEPRKVCLERAHLEEDAGKSLHDESQPGQPSSAGQQSKIDLNRAGTPLLEIVTKPDLRSAAEAKAFLQELKLILTYIAVSDCNMQEGSLRCDANVNLHIPFAGTNIATPIAEIKNLNSFRSVERAIDYESQRQFTAWQNSGLTIHEAPKQTRGWDDRSQTTVLQREKEDSADYRYFPCPDLIAYRTGDDEIESLHLEIGQLPAELRAMLIQTHQLKPYDADVIVAQGRGVVDYFLDVAEQTGDSRLTANWITQEVLRSLNESNIPIEQFPVSTDQLSGLLQRITNHSLDQSRAKEVLATMIAQRLDAASAIEQLGIISVDSDELQQLAKQIFDQNPDVIEQIRQGNTKAIGALVGQARKVSPNANPGAVKDAILKLL